MKFLRCILDALDYQTVKPEEIIISEDGNDPEMKSFLISCADKLPIVHLTRKDVGWTKNNALNDAIRSSSNPYLIFIDGDCVPHPKFIENHLKFAQEKTVLAGKRIKLGEQFSEKLLSQPISIFIKKFIYKISALKRDKAKFVEEGIYLNPNGITGLIGRLRSIENIKGCNFSCHKSTIVSINGFDEDYTKPAIGEDIDLVWRFKGLGYSIKSVRNFAVQYHLHHPESWSSQEENERLMAAKQKQNLFICKNGLEKLS